MKNRKSILNKCFAILMLMVMGFGAMSFTEANTVKVCASSEIHNHDGWINWGDDEIEKTSLPTEAGSYYLSSDITIAETWLIPNGTEAEPLITNICLNGYVIKLDSNSTGSVFEIQQYATLNLYDCGIATHEGYVDDSGLWHLGGDSGISKVISGGIITGGNNTKSYSGGGIFVNKGKLNIYNGNIVGNSANTYGGSIYIFGGIVNIYGGTISYNTSHAGGGISVAKKGTLNIYSGEITYNQADYGGGVIVAANTTFNMYGGSITNNVAKTNGAGICMGESITLGGSAKITENFTNETYNNIYIYKDETISFGSGDYSPTTMSAGITPQIAPTNTTPVKITTSGIAEDMKYFFADDDGYKIEKNTEDYLQLTLKTVADILPEYLLTSSSNVWENKNGYAIAYVYNDKLWLHEKNNPTSLVNDLLINTPLEKNGNNFVISAGEKTYTFVMEDGVLYSIVVTGGVSDYFNGTYTVPHAHGDWEITLNNNILTATCGESGCSETPYCATLTLSANDEVFSEDANHEYSSASAIWSNSELGFSQPTLKYYLVIDDDLVLTTNKNSGATKDDDGSAPCWAGDYVVKATLIINEESYTIEKPFSITKAEIVEIGFADKIEQPVANEIAINIFSTQTKYNGAINWSPTLLAENKFDCDTVYTATVTLTANSNYTFKDGALETTYIVDGWTKSKSSTDTELIFTKTFEKTAEHSLIIVNGQSPTCTADGYKDAYFCNVCDKYFEDEDGQTLIGGETAYNAWKLAGGKISTIDHHYSGEVTYTWDGNRCTASWHCDHEGCNEIESETVIAVYVKDTDATQKSNEKGHYEATFENPNFTKQVTEPNSVEKENTMLKGLSGGAIAGISIGSTLLLIIIAYVSMFFYWKKKDKAIKFLIPSYKWINKTFFKK